MLETLALAALFILTGAMIVGMGFVAYFRWRTHLALNAALDEMSAYITEIDELITEAEDAL